MSPPVQKALDNDHGKTARNIDAIIRLEQESRRELTPAYRFFHRLGWFVGTVYFSIFQCVGLSVWIGLNAGPLRLQHQFDPYPFPLLSAILSLEAVFLTSFVLIRQTAIDMEAERRNHLDLQINMLAEQEATATLRLLRRLAEHLDLEEDFASASDASSETPVENIARHLKAQERRTN